MDSTNKTSTFTPLTEAEMKAVRAGDPSARYSCAISFDCSGTSKTSVACQGDHTCEWLYNKNGKVIGVACDGKGLTCPGSGSGASSDDSKPINGNKL